MDLKKIDLKPIEEEILYELAPVQTGLSVYALCASLGLSLSTVSSYLKILEAKKLVKKVSSRSRKVFWVKVKDTQEGVKA